MLAIGEEDSEGVWAGTSEEEDTVRVCGEIQGKTRVTFDMLQEGEEGVK